ncbi:DUF452 family protein [Sinirhodobacter sp. HNIBRBA609]|nr:DUF452 family protein [Sinirhodobacter sp. HNIBRBA609]
MRRHWLAREGADELTLVFSGWGLGAAPFTALTGAADVLVVNDYIDLDDPLPEVAGYARLRLLAYSFGVASAAHWLARTGVRPARLVAVNGTLHPVDPQRGIPPETVAGTADGLNAENFVRFCQRAGVTEPVPAIDYHAAAAELRVIAARGAAQEIPFDRIWIADGDRIIPTAAQVLAWSEQAAVVRRIPGGHMPFCPGQSWQEWFA